MSQEPATAFTGYQKFVIGLLAFLQFTIVLDFMIIAPLGAILMPQLHITPAQFGWVVSAYAFSAGLSGIIAAGFADKFDRKKFLLFFYGGFVLGTLLCGLAPTYELLLFARMVTGLFAGVIGSVVMAITTDLFPFAQRGRVMGFVQTAFAGSQVLGLPAGLYFANLWGWHAPFMMIVGISALMGLLIAAYMKPVNEHLKLQQLDKNVFHHLTQTISTPRYLLAFATTGLLSVGGFMLMPFMSAFTVNNVGIPLTHLPFIYLVTGLCAIGIGPILGYASDAYGKFNVFMLGGVLTAVIVLIYTHLGITPIGWVMLLNVLMFVGIFARIIPSQALMSAIPEPASRGAFMSVSAALQQMSGGVASVVAGFIVVQSPTGMIEHYDTLGYILVGSVFITVAMMHVVNTRLVPNSARG